MKTFLALSVLLLAPVAEAATTTHRCTESSITVDESAGVISIQLERRHNLLEPSVGYIAIYGSTQWLLPNGLHRLEFAPNQIRKTLELPVDDDVYSGTQTTTIRCGTMHGRVAGPAESESTLTVLDDEAPPALAAPTVVDVTESNGSQFITIPLSIDKRFGRGGFVRVETIDVTTSPNDYHLEFPYVLFDRDETSDAIHLRIEGDGRAEPDEELILKLSGDVAPHEIRIRIADDDRPSFTLAFDKTSYAFDEGDRNASLTITRGGDLSVAFEATLVSERPRGRKWHIDIPLLFAAGETMKTIPLQLEDGVYTGPLVGIVELVYAESVLATATVAVRDDDRKPVLSIHAGSGREGDEGEHPWVPVTLEISGGTALPLSVRVVTSDGTATRDDYSPIDQTFVIPAARESWPLSLYFKGDSSVEPDETVTISIVDCCDDDLVTVDKRTATATIRNDDDGEPPTTYKFGDFPSVWNESQKWLTAPILRFNRLDRPSSATVTLYSFASRRSYEPVVLEFQPGESRKDARFFIDDHFYSAETRVPILIDSSRRREESRSLTIVDDESPTVVTFEDARVTETATNQRKELFISIDPPSDSQLFFDVKTTAGTASGDFLDVPHYVIVPARTSTASVPFTLAGDSIPEEDETFSVNLELISNIPGQAILAKTAATCTIHDDDVGARLIVPSDHIERGKSATIAFELDAPAPTSEAIQLSSSAPQVLTVPATLELTAGSRTATFQVSGVRTGVATLRAQLPSWLGAKPIEAELIVSSFSLPVLPDLVRLSQGDTTTVSVSLTPPADHEVRLSIQSIDLRIAAADKFVVIAPGETGTFQLHGAKLGSNLIAITLPDELGGTVVHLPVEVIP
jgi:hypothetical protein